MPTLPPPSRIAVAVLFVASGLNQLVQAPGELLDPDGLPRLGVLHLLAGLPGIATAWCAWRATRWAWATALAWAFATATLILSLESLLQLPAEEARGFRPAVVIIGAVGLLSSWYLFRVARRPAGNVSTAPRD